MSLNFLDTMAHLMKAVFTSELGLNGKTGDDAEEMIDNAVNHPTALPISLALKPICNNSRILSTSKISYMIKSGRHISTRSH